MTEDAKPKKVETAKETAKTLKLAKETLRDPAGPKDASRRVKGGKGRPGTERARRGG